MQISGQAALVSGGASGLGLATAKLLADRGARVAILDLDREKGEKAASAIGGTFHQTDVADDANVVASVDAAAEAHGAARILVNCAGIAPGARTVNRENAAHPAALFRKTVEVNLIGTFNLLAQFAARAAVVEELNGERAVVINTASIAGYDGQIGQAAYASSKGGVIALTLPVARDLAALKIRVMTIAPGIFLTPMVEGFAQNVQDALGAQVPHPSRLGKPAEYAQLVESIISNPMLNGEVIRIDGAIRMAPK